MLNYTYVGPTLLVVPLFLISLVNLFIAGPPLKTVVLNSNGPTYGARLPFMQLHVQGGTARFSLSPKDEMTHFFVITCYAQSVDGALSYDAQVVGKRPGAAPASLVHESTAGGRATHGGEQGRLSGKQGSDKAGAHALQMLQPLLGYSEYDVTIVAKDGARAATSLPPMEFRLTYVPTRFTNTQVLIRAFFTCTSLCMLALYLAAMAGARAEPGQLWMLALLVLLLGVNDPLYIARVVMGGNAPMYAASVLAQILFSGGLFLFWLVYADSMAEAEAATPPPGCLRLFPKLALVGTYVGVSAAMFLLHGRVPDRINVTDAEGLGDSVQRYLVYALSASVVAVGVWLSVLIARVIRNLGWKKVEYIYTEREKSFVGITMVFVILWLSGHVYRAVHGRRGSWMQLQMPFLTLTNSYLGMLAHAFWPGARGDGAGAGQEGDDDESAKQQGLLEEDAI